MTVIIKIKETDETKELTLIDPKSKNCWVKDLMGNHGAFDNNEEDPDDDSVNAVFSQEDYNWWEDLIHRYQEAENRLYDLLKEGQFEEEIVVQLKNDYLAVDLEQYPEALHQVCNILEKSNN